MNARIVKVAEMDASEISRWADLLEMSLDPYPFMDPRMVVPAAKHLPTAKDMSLVIVEDDSEFLALMPFAPFRILKGLPPRGISTENDFLDKESTWNHPLIRADRAVESLEALLLGLRTLGLPRLLDFRTIPAGGAFEEAFWEVSTRLGAPSYERERREFAYSANVTHEHGTSERLEANEPSFELGHASRRTRKTIERRGRALEAKLNTPLRIDDRGANPEAIEQFIELQDSGWKGDASRGGHGIRIMGYEPWFREVTSRYRDDNRLAVHALTAGANLIYLSVAFRIGASMFGYGDTYDEDFAAFGPGVLGRVAVINRALNEPGIESFEPNLSPYYVADSMLCADRHTRIRVLVANGGLVATSMVKGLPRAHSLRRRIGRSE